MRRLRLIAAFARHSIRQPLPSAIPIADSVRSRSGRPGRRGATCNVSLTPSCARIVHSPRSARSPPSLPSGPENTLPSAVTTVRTSPRSTGTVLPGEGDAGGVPGEAGFAAARTWRQFDVAGGHVDLARHESAGAWPQRRGDDRRRKRDVDVMEREGVRADRDRRARRPGAGAGHQLRRAPRLAAAARIRRATRSGSASHRRPGSRVRAGGSRRRPRGAGRRRSRAPCVSRATPPAQARAPRSRRRSRSPRQGQPRAAPVPSIGAVSARA